MNDLSVLRGHYIENSPFQNMKRKTSKPRELTISSAKRTRFGMSVMSRAPEYSQYCQKR